MYYIIDEKTNGYISNYGKQLHRRYCAKVFSLDKAKNFIQNYKNHLSGKPALVILSINSKRLP